MDSTSQTRRSVRGRFATGITVASTGILAASLVAVPPDHHAAQVEYQAIRLVAITAPWPGVTESPTPVNASAATTPIAANSASWLQNTLGNLAFATFFLGALASAGLLILPVAVLGFVIAVPKEILGAIKTLVDKVTGRPLGSLTPTPAARQAARPTRATTRAAHRSVGSVSRMPKRVNAQGHSVAHSGGPSTGTTGRTMPVGANSGLLGGQTGVGAHPPSVSRAHAR